MDNNINDLAARLEQTPSSAIDADWKTFLLKNPWYPSRLLIKHFGIQKYDLDNWKRTHAAVRVALSNPRDNFRDAETPQDMRSSLAKAWKFFFDSVLQSDLSNKHQALEIANLQGIGKSDWAFLLDSKVLRQLDDYERWVAQGYTQFSFIVFNIYPGEARARSVGLVPSLFAQTSKVHTRTELIELLEHIYLSFLADTPSAPTEDDIADAKRIFYVRAGEASFITNERLRRYGFRANMTPHGVKDIVQALRHKFGVDLGLEATPNNNWSTSEFRKRFPDRKLSECQYCGRKPVDLHHLLERNEYPELIYDNDNVVPLCTLAHSAITRNALPLELAQQLISAAEQWKVRSEKKIKAFDSVMKAIHAAVYDSNSA